ncbi:MAG: hypothetical protein IJ781_09905 [Atopobiaceae bacterium]|nr:hypothetical protein [Atopobiaceae bacterium]
MGKVARLAKVATAAGAVGAAYGALVAPRRGGEDVASQWEKLCTYRYAHRGLHDNRTPAPENSLAAFRLAREWGYGSELDVHLTADDQLVVIHDSRLQRACGVEGVVEDKSLAELADLRLFGTHEGIPTFESVLDVYEGGMGPCPPLVVEIKTHGDNYARLTERVMAALDTHQVPYCVESFDPRVLWWLRRNRPEVVRGQLSENFVVDKDSDLGFARGFTHGALIFNVFARPDFVAYRHDHRRRVAVWLACRLLGARLVTWTIKSPEELAEVEDAGGVGIFEGFEPGPRRAEG